MTEEIKLQIEVTEKHLLDYFNQLSPELKKIILEQFVFSEIIEVIEQQLKHQTDISTWSTSGWRDGMNIREAIIKIQGLEPEFKKDLESIIRSLKWRTDYLEKYYRWFFKVYHNENTYPIVSKYIGFNTDKE